jgi:hypothetical protein
MAYKQIQYTSKKNSRICEHVCIIFPSLNEEDYMTLYESMSQKIVVLLEAKGC